MFLFCTYSVENKPTSEEITKSKDSMATILSTKKGIHNTVYLKGSALSKI